jgi:hypothetical protein
MIVQTIQVEYGSETPDQALEARSVWTNCVQAAIAGLEESRIKRMEEGLAVGVDESIFRNPPGNKG